MDVITRWFKLLMIAAIISLSTEGLHASALFEAAHGEIDRQLREAAAYRAAGHHDAARIVLGRALCLAEAAGELRQRVEVRARLADTLLAMQRVTDAEIWLEDGLNLAEFAEDPALGAHLLNNAGNVYYVQEKYSQAKKNYRHAASLAEQAGDENLATQILANRARLALKDHDRPHKLHPPKNRVSQPVFLETRSVPESSTPDSQNHQTGAGLIHELAARVQSLPDSEGKAFRLLTAGQLYLRLSAPPYLAQGHRLFSEAADLAERYQNTRLQSQARAYLGQVYERVGQHAAALRFTREAIFLAQNEADLLYRWEWQRGRLLQAQGRLSAAEQAYKTARKQLRFVRPDLLTGQRDTSDAFLRRIRPVYYDLADVLLQQAAQTVSPPEKSALLEEAIKTIEELKSAELQDYFQDDCVVAQRRKIRDITAVLPKNSAILYPMLLDDRLELLLTSAGEIRQYVVRVKAKDIDRAVNAFRRNLQTAGTYEFLDQAWQLYQWLIAPVMKELQTQRIDTLVVAPDGSLRTIPFAALHDGKDFLFRRMALVITPGMELTDPRRLPRKRGILLNGLSEGVQGFNPLEHVPDELKGINRDYADGEGRVLLDQEFKLNRLESSLREASYTVVHIASHGQFDRNPKQSFLLTYDGKINMNRLLRLMNIGRFRKEAVELMSLSACQTAAGDERAALGLAGVAVRSGARSALATLWFVSDKTTSELMVEFYRRLRNPQLSKAQALQQAQIALYEKWSREWGESLVHPVYWSPFILIGNWL
ncbi:MAG: CHAT domain-containing protein [Gammaproteobacteria bacterium]|nr:CHAT domain-containing protein [Gammaproteobacteria bacterium]